MVARKLESVASLPCPDALVEYIARLVQLVVELSCALLAVEIFSSVSAYKYIKTSRHVVLMINIIDY